MARILPPHPDIDHLKNEAKALLKAHGAGEAAACGTLRLLQRFREASDREVFAAEVALSEAQFALAMDYGFKSWEDLRQHVMKVSDRPDIEDEARPGALLIDSPPAGKGNSNRYARGFAITLAYSGVECDYDTITGDSGLAFILQADEHVTPWGKPIKQVDIGWWPLTWWGALMRLDFVSSCVGRQLVRLPIDAGLRRTDPKRHYDEYFEKGVLGALRSDRLPLAFSDHCWVVTGHDDGEPPIVGLRSVFDGHERIRPRCCPDEVIVPGEAIERPAREGIDREALNYALALGRYRVEELIRTVPRCSGQGIKPAGGRSTGQKSFALWARLLRDEDGWGEHFYHTNVVMHLRINRQSAPPYLRGMADRHGEPAASHLRAGADVYEQVLKRVESADTGKETLRSPSGREALARLVEETARLEAEALRKIENALGAMT